MPKEFHQGCLSFRYPDNWQLEREEADSGWTVSLQSPDTAFLTLTLDEDFPEPERMADTALEALRSEYAQIDADEAAERIAGRWAVGHDISFFSFDLLNSCWTRSFETPDGTVLLVCQSADMEMPEHEPVLRAVCASLRVQEPAGERGT